MSFSALEPIPTEEFIDAVRKRRCLYDTHHPDYKHCDVRAEAWLDIVKELGGKNVSTMKMRWRSLKDCYLKHKRACDPRLCTSLNRQYRKWRWAQFLTFLDPYMTISPKSQSIIYKKVTDDPHTRMKQKLKTKVKKEVLDDEVPDYNGSSYVDSPQFSEVLVQTPQTLTEVKKKDDIYYLFMSYSELFRKFSAKKRVMMKLDLANLFLKAEMEYLDEMEGNTTNVEVDGSNCMVTMHTDTERFVTDSDLV